MSTRTIVALAGLIAAGLLCHAASGQAQRPGPSGGPGRGFDGRRGPTDEERERARVTIGMSREQQKQLEAVFHDSEARMRDVMTRIRDRYKELNELYAAYDFDRARARGLIRELTDLRRKVLESRTDNEERMRKVLTREQFDKLRALLAREWQRRGAFRGPSPPPPPTP